jgi:hypothetical protein
MKTFEQIAEEVAGEMKEKIHPVILDRYSHLGVKEIVNEAAKRYARQCCEDVLSRAAENAKKEADPAQFGDFGKSLFRSITSTEIVLP